MQIVEIYVKLTIGGDMVFTKKDLEFKLLIMANSKKYLDRGHAVDTLKAQYERLAKEVAVIAQGLTSQKKAVKTKKVTKKKRKK